MKRFATSKSRWLLAAAVLWAAAALSRDAAVTPPPEVLFEDLFAAVQMAHLYPDGKFFVDATPKESPAKIMASYHENKPADDAALRRFVEAHFVLPQAAATPPSTPQQVALSEHIDKLWDVLTRNTPKAPAHSSLLTLPKPYVVPGGRFREMYYWDSYFTMLGLAESGRSDLLKDMIDDFAHLIDTYGHIPNGTRTYYLSRSQPPFFYLMVGLLTPKDPGAAYAQYLPELKREHAFWMEGERTIKQGERHRRVVGMPDGSILNRYWDDRDQPRDESFRDDTLIARSSKRPAAEIYRDIRAAAESGWDFGSRWFEDGAKRETMITTDIAPPDLNALLFGLENAIADGCVKAKSGCESEYKARAARRRASVIKYLWDESGAFYDYRLSTHARIPRISAATLYPLFTGLAEPEQAKAVGARARAELLKAGGIVTSTLNTDEQWDAPNGWAPLQWIAVSGLRGYGEAGLAQDISCRWLSNVEAVYKDSGKLVEKYDVVTTGRSGGGGEYPSQDGFGWTNGVTLKLLHLYSDCHH